MSVQAMGWVFRHSPHKGVTFAVHLAIADSVNDQHGMELWMGQTKLAQKARTTRPSVQAALRTLMDAGHLELLEEGNGTTNRYRLLMPDSAAVVFDPAKPVGTRGAKHDGRGVQPQTAGGAKPDGRGVPSQLALTQEEPKQPKLERGRRIATQVWEQSDPKPATPFVAAAQIAEKLLDAGHDEAAVTAAMLAAPTISVRAVELQLSQQRPPRRRSTVTERRDEPSGRVKL